VESLILDVLTVLFAGLVAGAICRRLDVSLLVGYLVVGVLIGPGVFGLVSAQKHELKELAEAGALLLLFSIGIEFSIGELMRMGRYLLVGGTVQMTLVGATGAGAGLALGASWRTALLLGAAAALSSTVLVFKALEEYGQVTTQHGRRAVGILLFQDFALVPLMLLVPLLVGSEDQPPLREWAALGVRSVLFVSGVAAARYVVQRWAVPLLAALRSPELVVLFTLIVLGGSSIMAARVGLPPALGAFAAGLMLSGNRLTGQIDALVLPFRESFAVVFFVSLGALFRPDVLFTLQGALLSALGLVGLLALKTAAAAVALRLTGLRWRMAWGMGLGLSQMGELSFILLSAGYRAELIDAGTYNVALLLAIGSLILTPPLLKWGLRRADPQLDRELEGRPPSENLWSPARHALVVGMGPVGRRVTSLLETRGVDVAAIDLSPVNLHPLAQLGFHTVAGDARQADVLHRAGGADCVLAVITVPDDVAALEIVRALRRINADARVVVRCRYQLSAPGLQRAGADVVVSEEVEASAALQDLLE